MEAPSFNRANDRSWALCGRALGNRKWQELTRSDIFRRSLREGLFGEIMRPLVIVGVVALIVWMGFITWRVEQTRELAMRACGMAWAANSIIGNHYSFPRECPGSGLVEPEIVKSSK